jgi:hypothetical protein
MGGLMASGDDVGLTSCRIGRAVICSLRPLGKASPVPAAGMPNDGRDEPTLASPRLGRVRRKSRRGGAGALWGQRPKS